MNMILPECLSLTYSISQAAAIKEARRQAEEKARLEEQARREEQARQQEQARRAAAAEQAAAAKKREQENVWATRISQSPPAQENTNPWANLVSDMFLNSIRAVFQLKLKSVKTKTRSI